MSNSNSDLFGLELSSIANRSPVFQQTLFSDTELLVKNELSNIGVDVQLLPENVNNWKFIPLPSSNLIRYTLTKRVTSQKLIRNFSKTVAKAQFEYLEEIKRAHKVLTDNLHTCCEVDLKLRDDDTQDYESEEECLLEKLKDGTWKLDCPLKHCKTSSFKLKRHLIEQHLLDEETVKFCMDFSRKAAKNKVNLGHNSREDALSSSVDANPSKKRNVYQNTALVSRKGNYKRCSICSKLCLNISQHIGSFHGLNRKDFNYHETIQKSEVVPKVYTKRVNGETRILSGTEMDEAVAKYGEQIEEESSTLEKLKALREKMESIKKKVLEAEEKNEHDSLKKELIETESEYRSERYKDTREYSENVLKWKKSFVDFLKIREYDNPERGARMAVDVMSPYEKIKQSGLTFDDLLDGKTVRDLLVAFKKVEGITATSKAKYLKMFELMAKFLICDCCSPEKKSNETPEQLLGRKIKMDEVLHEIECLNVSLKKKKGEDLLATRKRARNRLVEEEELEVILADINESLKKLKNETPEQMTNYSKKKVLDVRNSLMAAGAIRLGRRSTELMTMTIEEVEGAELSTVDGELFYIIKVEKQKNLKHGKEAPIVFSGLEYESLLIFIKYLRPKLSNDKFHRSVFVPQQKLKCTGDNDLSYSGAYNILRKFETSSGKKLSSRAIRTSKITNNRKTGTTDQERRDVARAMSHSVETADRYYDYTDLSSSVSKSLSVLSKSRFSTSQDTDSINETVEKIDDSLCTELSNSEAVTSTPVKEIAVQRGNKSLRKDEISSATKRKYSVELNETLKTLRRKKVKATDSSSQEKKLQLPALIERIHVLSKEIPREEFYSKNGSVSIQPVTRALSKGITRLFSVKEIRLIVEEVIGSGHPSIL